MHSFCAQKPVLLHHTYFSPSPLSLARAPNTRTQNTYGPRDYLSPCVRVWLRETNQWRRKRGCAGCWRTRKILLVGGRRSPCAWKAAWKLRCVAKLAVYVSPFTLALLVFSGVHTHFNYSAHELRLLLLFTLHVARVFFPADK